MNRKSLFSRRKFLRLCGSSLLALWSFHPLEALAAKAKPAAESIGTAAQAAPVPPAQPASLGTEPVAADFDALRLRQLITADSRTSRTIMWESAAPQADGQLLWRLAGQMDIQSLSAAGRSFTEDDQTSYIHTAMVTGLQPGQHYEYRIIANGRGTAWQPLPAATAGPFKALIFPDSQCSDDYGTWRDLAQNAAARNPDTDFFINMGDLVDNGESSYQWRAWFDALAGILERLPFAPVMGNHATYDLNWKIRLPLAWLRYFRVPGNGSTRFPNYYYSFDYGPVHFSVLNTQWEELDPLRPGILEEQRSWLAGDVAASRAPWKVVLMHKDIINYEDLSSLEPLADIDPVGKALMPLFDQLGIDAVLTAHQHTYRRHDHIFNFAPADHGPFYIDTGVAGNVRYDVQVDPRFDKKVLPQPEVDNYLTLEASAQALHFKCFQPDGSLADEAWITKK